MPLMGSQPILEVSLAWEPPCAEGMALKKAKRQRKARWQKSRGDGLALSHKHNNNKKPHLQVK